VDGNVKGVEFLFKKNKIDAFRGTGRSLAPGKVEVTPDNGEAETIETRASSSPPARWPRCRASRSTRRWS
jgi:pyruvate/2-oxoglutarate dehydrogenase complex dihydrolipoamide dehydrogenase (E3) component